MSWSGAQYDEVASPQAGWGSEVVQRLLAELTASRHPTVLDAGCGPGRQAEELLDARADLTAVAADRSESMLEQAARRLARFGARAAVVRLDLDVAEPVPQQLRAGVDAVLSTGTFHWVLDPASMYARLAELLRPGGALVAQCGGEGSLREVRAVLDELGVEWRSFNRYAGAQETRAWLVDAGFGEAWTWLSHKPVEFPDRHRLASFLSAGALSPYLTHLDEAARRELAHAVADRLERPSVEFVRLNILARRPNRTTA